VSVSFDLFFGVLFAIMAAVIGYLIKRVGDLDAELDRMKETYVRRDDMLSSTGKLEKSIDEIKADVKAMSTLLIKAMFEKK
jgi:hypothetical protein